jgi:hypothetical protein
MRKTLALALLAGLCALPAAGASESTTERVSRYFAEWFSYCPQTRVRVSPAPEIALPGYESYRAERQCSLKNRNEMSVTLLDTAKNEIFIGDVLHSDERRGEPFSPSRDVPVLESVFRESFGLPVSIRVEPSSRGPLRAIRLSIRQAEGAEATMPGFVSEDGATVLLGEFFPFDVPPARLRERLLEASPGVRPQKGNFVVTAFIDFQCEKCRVRTPHVRDFAWTHGGGLEVRFLPLVKIHNWAFAAAESAAALSNVSPSLYMKYEEAIFPRASQMNEASARELAADVAEAAGVRAAFEAELKSGRARSRVLADIDLALRLGLNSTPVFFYGGTYLSSEDTLAEDYIGSQILGTRKPAGGGPRR